MKNKLFLLTITCCLQYSIAGNEPVDDEKPNASPESSHTTSTRVNNGSPSTKPTPHLSTVNIPQSNNEPYTVDNETDSSTSPYNQGHNVRQDSDLSYDQLLKNCNFKNNDKKMYNNLLEQLKNLNIPEGNPEERQKKLITDTTNFLKALDELVSYGTTSAKQYPIRHIVLQNYINFIKDCLGQPVEICFGNYLPKQTIDEWCKLLSLAMFAKTYVPESDDTVKINIDAIYLTIDTAINIDITTAINIDITTATKTARKQLLKSLFKTFHERLVLTVQNTKLKTNKYYSEAQRWQYLTCALTIGTGLLMLAVVVFIVYHYVF